MTCFQTQQTQLMTFDKSNHNSRASFVSLHVNGLHTRSVPEIAMPVNGKTAAGPLTPTLAANYRAPNRQAPQTPRLASTATLSHGSSTTRSTNVSAEKRFQGLSVSVESPKGGAAGIRKNKNGSATPVRDIPTAATTAASLLGGNVTPRSSTRKSRTDSNKSTPSNTPIGTPTLGSNPAKERAAEVDMHHVSHDISSRSVVKSKTSSSSDFVGKSPTLHLAPVSHTSNTLSSASPTTKPANAKFFYANDASKGPTIQKTHDRPPLRKAATFFHASGVQERVSLAQTKSVPPSLSADEREALSVSKFCHIDETLSSRSAISSPPSLTSSPASSTFASPTQPFPSLRPPSPLKENIHLSYRKGVSQVIRPSCHRLSAASLPAFTGRPTPVNDSGDGDKANKEAESRRRMSSPNDAVVEQATPMKRKSFSSIDAGTPTKSDLLDKEASQVGAPSPEKHLAQLSPSFLSGVVTNKNAQQLEKGCNKEIEESQRRSERKGLSLSSPLSVNVSGEQQDRVTNNAQIKSTNVAELAANARRERKVLDLEISNSSLLAINRQLEREVRKQKVELRRFRRLSRAGHISLGRTSSSACDAKRCISGSTVATGLDEGDDTQSEYQNCNNHYLNNNEFGDSEYDDDEEEEEEDISASDVSSITNSSKPYTNRRIARDERRLRLDLSKHRELLVDSQKMNQGLRRCIDWTEELVRDGRRALDYKVRVSDVKLGGRVLRSEDDQLSDDEIEIDDKSKVDACEERPANIETDYGNSGDVPDRVEILVGSTNADKHADEVKSDSAFVSPWRSGVVVGWSQQHATQCTPDTVPVITDYFGSEALSELLQSENTLPA